METADVVIVGAGVAGLCCARRLSEAGIGCHVFEASDEVGGRIRSDRMDGFILDRGFQVLLTAYPEAKAFLDYQALDVKAFEPGALIRCDLGSLNGAMASGRRAADAVIKRLKDE